jgi:hypothetical protein
MNNAMMTSFFSKTNKNKKQKTSTEAAASLAEGAAAETDTRSNNDDDDDDDAFQNQPQESVKLPATKPKKTMLNTCSQEHAATQLPRIDNDGHLHAAFGKGSASVANRKRINDVDAWFDQRNPTFPVHLVSNASVRAKKHAPVKGNMWTEQRMEKAMTSPHSQHDDPVSEQSPDAGSANEWDGGFAKKGWSRSLNGFSKSTLANTHLDGSLTPFQRRQLCKCHAETSKCFDVEEKELHKQVADLFNRQHEAKFSEDQCGHGGRIREKRVAAFLEVQGSALLQGRLGVQPSPHLLALPIRPASIGASAACNVPWLSMCARATPLRPAMHCAHQATINFTVPTSSEIENYSRRERRDALAKTHWSSNGLLDDLRRRLLQCYKLKRIPKNMPGRAANGRQRQCVNTSSSFSLFSSLLPLFFVITNAASS